MNKKFGIVLGVIIVLLATATGGLTVAYSQQKDALAESEEEATLLYEKAKAEKEKVREVTYSTLVGDWIGVQEIEGEPAIRLAFFEPYKYDELKLYKQEIEKGTLEQYSSYSRKLGTSYAPVSISNIDNVKDGLATIEVQLKEGVTGLEALAYVPKTGYIYYVPGENGVYDRLIVYFDENEFYMLSRIEYEELYTDDFPNWLGRDSGNQIIVDSILEKFNLTLDDRERLITQMFDTVKELKSSGDLE